MVQDQVWSKAGVCDVRILILTCLGSEHERGNNRQVRRGIRWNFTTVLEDLDFADDIALLSSKISDLQEKTGRLEEEAARVGLKRNVKTVQDTENCVCS